MKAAVRLILVLLGLLLTGAGIFCIALGFDLVPSMRAIMPAMAGEMAVAALGGGLLLVGLILLSLSLRSASPKEKTPDNVLQIGEYGEIRIAIIAIENMVLRVVQQTHGVRDNGRRVVNSPEGMIVHVQVKVLPDLELPGLINELQGKIKSYVEEITGIMVQEVKVMVENIILDQAPAKKSIRPQ